jgi:beta-glucosidase-like glycosyl hydrolase/CubicO group peptidase (beta-lactamase class C family)
MKMFSRRWAIALLFAWIPLLPAQSPDAVPQKLLAPNKAWAAATLGQMTLREKVAQLVHVRVNGRFLNRNGPEFTRLADDVRKNRVGGVILFAGNAYESAVLLNKLQQLAKVPLMVSADFERGAAFRIADTTSFPWTMAVGAAGSEELAYKAGAITAREARALGVHWVFAPVVDVNNNPENSVINIRSYGEDPELVARLGAAFIRGCRDNGVLTTAKHFPGHGDTETDSHIGLAVVASDRARLDAVELVPFRRAIEVGVDSVMTAHVAVPQLTGDAATPATLSHRILTDLLRKDLGFQGMVVTDALEMGGITARYGTGKAAIKALQAGADLLLLPPDTNVAINEVVRAVRRGDIPEAQINRSVRKLLTAKTRLGLQTRRSVPVETIDRVVATEESRQTAQEIADRSITLVRDEARLLPLSPVAPARLLSLVLSAEPDPAPAATFQAEMRQRFPRARTSSIDPRTPAATVAAIVKSAEDSDVVICSTVVRVISGKGSVSLPENLQAVLNRLMAAGKPVVWVAFGNPYVLRACPQAKTYLCAFSYADVSYVAAAKALAGEIAITGRMPVGIPGQCQVGDGLQTSRLDLRLKPAPAGQSGLAPQTLEKSKELLKVYVDTKVYPGAALVVGHRGSIVLAAAAGSFDYRKNSPAVTPDTVYDLASLSKAVGTTSAAMMLVDSGRLNLSAPVQEYVPEFQGPDKDKVRVQHLLAHTSGLPGFEPLYEKARGYQKILELVYGTPLQFEPGSRTRYSDLGMMLLGEILARAAGRPLDQFLAEQLFAPLGMKSTVYKPAKTMFSRIPPTEKDPWRKRVVRGQVHDENAYAMGGVAGHAGLFASASDLAVYAQLMLNQGWYDHRRYFHPDTVAGFTSADGAERGLGWGKPATDSWTGRVFSRAAIGHTGFTGTTIWIDPDRQLFIILLSNRVHPSRDNKLLFDQAVQAIVEAVLGAAPPAVTTHTGPGNF